MISANTLQIRWPILQGPNFSAWPYQAKRKKNVSCLLMPNCPFADAWGKFDFLCISKSAPQKKQLAGCRPSWWWIATIATRRSFSHIWLQKQLISKPINWKFPNEINLKLQLFVVAGNAICISASVWSLRSPFTELIHIPAPAPKRLECNTCAFWCLAPLWTFYGVSAGWQSHDRQMAGCQKLVSIWGRDPSI